MFDNVGNVLVVFSLVIFVLYVSRRNTNNAIKTQALIHDEEITELRSKVSVLAYVVARLLKTRGWLSNGDGALMHGEIAYLPSGDFGKEVKVYSNMWTSDEKIAFKQYVNRHGALPEGVYLDDNDNRRMYYTDIRPMDEHEVRRVFSRQLPSGQKQKGNNQNNQSKKKNNKGNRPQQTPPPDNDDDDFNPFWNS